MNGQVRAGLSYWAITIIGLLWNCFGGFDYYMTQSRNAAYLAQFPPELLSFIQALPVWTVVAWAIGVWGSVLGSVLMLLRSRFAVPAFAISLLGLAVSTAYQVTIGLPAAMKAPPTLAIQATIWVVLIFLVWYTRRCQVRGILR